MAVPTSPLIESKSTTPAWRSGCISIFAALFGILGIWNTIFGLAIIYIFISIPMLSPANIALILVIAGYCLIYFLLAFRVKRQHWLISLGLLVVVWLVLPIMFRFLINTTTMRVRQDGYSMGDSLPNGSYILVDKQAHKQRSPQRGDIVIFSLPSSSDTTTLLMKRVIGLPGEVVSINEGQVSIDGIPLNEPYVFVQATYNGEWNVTEGYYFVLGDNRPDSRDSHQWGLLPRENILGKAVWIYFPLNQFGEIIDINFAP